MDTFELCRIASERAAWSFEASLQDLTLDFRRRFLPKRICGHDLPSWLDTDAKMKINHIRGFSYAHVFCYIEQFIIQATCNSAAEYIHVDRDALSAMLRFTDEETKHQRMFDLVKEQVVVGLGFQPGEITDKEQAAQFICAHSPFAVYLAILMIEWFTQRHYVECFRDEESDLDPGYVKVFRLHWTEEAQHARIDTVQLRTLIQDMTPSEITDSMEEFVVILHALYALVRTQNELDIVSIEHAIDQTLSVDQRNELLEALHTESFWTFFESGLQHTNFRNVYEEIAPPGTRSLSEVQQQVRAHQHEVQLPPFRAM